MPSELVDILAPPDFAPTGLVKPVRDALDDGDWVGVMNLWIARPGPSLIYQERPAGGAWSAGKLDGSVGGYYRAGEFGLDGLREAKEELGWACPTDRVTEIGRHLSVMVDTAGLRRHLVVTVYMTFNDMPLGSFSLDPEEVPAIYDVPVHDVLKAFSDESYRFLAKGINSAGQSTSRIIGAEDFTYVFGGYHRRVATIAAKFAAGEGEFGGT